MMAGEGGGPPGQVPLEPQGMARRADQGRGRGVLVKAKVEPAPQVGHLDSLRTRLQRPASHQITLPCVLRVHLHFVGRMGGGILFTQTVNLM